MNGSKSPAPANGSGDTENTKGDAPTARKGQETVSAADQQTKSSPVPSIEAADEELPDAPPQNTSADKSVPNGVEEDHDSEAETLIESPVKKKEAERRNASATIKTEKAQKSRIGSLPVPQDDDEDGDSAASPMLSTEVSVEPSGDMKTEDVDMADEDADAEGSDVLSSAHSSHSRDSSPSRAMSEGPEDITRNGATSPNPRKRKHRASSLELLSSNKRRSMDPPARRRLRGMHSEEGTNDKSERSPSPKARGHRRAVSTQSALDGTVESSARKRRAGQFPVREPKSAKSMASLEESDASSETTSRGQDEFKRPQRGTARSTSTPGRPVGRDHKRHINRYGFTRLAEACEDGDVDLVKEWREKDPDQLELPEFAGNTPLQIAALNGHTEVVQYLIDEGAKIDCANADKDTPLIDAVENGHLDVVKLLLNAGVDPLCQNMKGQQPLDVVSEGKDGETRVAKLIRKALHDAIDAWNSSEARAKREEEEEFRHRAGPSKELHFMARTYENMLRLVQINDRTGVQEFLAARVPVDNAIIAAAAKTGDLYLVNMLLAEMSEKKRFSRAEKPMLSVLGTSHFDMLKSLTELEQFNPTWRSRQGKTWPELAEERAGPMWKQEKELLSRLYDRAGGDKAGTGQRRSSSPVSKRDMGRRKLLQHQRSQGDDDDSEEDGDEETMAPATTAKRKNGRRLMSRKDLRTAKGGALSDSDGDSSEDAPGEVVEEEEEVAKPPETPNTRRRLRSKSQSDSLETSPKSLRKKRSGSMRGAGSSPEAKGLGLGLETVNEEAKEESSIEVKPSPTAEKLRKDREEEAKAALELAKKAAEKQKEEEVAEAEAKRAEEEAKRKAEEEKKAEEERLAEEKRKQDEIRAEQARKEEEERRLKELELAETNRTYRSQILSTLPSPLSRILDPESDSTFEGLKQKVWVEEHFSPLRVVDTDAHGEDWVLNLQAAVLLGKSGLELFFGADCPYYETSLAGQWTTQEVRKGDWTEVDTVLSLLPWNDPAETDDGNDEVSFAEEKNKAVERWNALQFARNSLKTPDCKAVIRRVRLTDVQSHLHPLLKTARVDVTYDAVNARRQKETLKSLKGVGDMSWFEKMKASVQGNRAPTSLERAIGDSCERGGVGVGFVRATDVVVVHEK